MNAALSTPQDIVPQARPDHQRLPLGISDFARMREPGAGGIYVDKTLWIMDMLATGRRLLFARPPRFGKSLLCSTIERLYRGDRDLFEGTCAEYRRDWRAVHPVLHLRVAEADGSDPHRLGHGLLALLRRRAEEERLELAATQCTQALPELVQALHRRHGRRVVVVVDAYDQPLLGHLGDAGAARRILDLLAAFYGALKSCDEDTEQVFFAGLGSPARNGVLRELAQVKDLSLHAAASLACGFTEDEVRGCFPSHLQRLAKATGRAPGDILPALMERYGGYWWGKGERVANPWSVLNCLSDQELGSYWWTTGGVEPLDEGGGVVDIPQGGLHATEQALRLDTTRPGAVARLWQSGGLSVAAVEGQAYTLDFPNAEVREAWNLAALDRLCGSADHDGAAIVSLLRAALERDDRPGFERRLAGLCAALPDGSNGERERSDRRLVLVLLAAMGAMIIDGPQADRSQVLAVLASPRVVHLLAFRCSASGKALERLKANRLLEAHQVGDRPVVLVVIGGFCERILRCQWEALTPPAGQAGSGTIVPDGDASRTDSRENPRPSILTTAIRWFTGRPDRQGLHTDQGKDMS